MEVEHTKQEHRNQPPKHAEKGPGLRLLARRRIIWEIWKFATEITNRSKAQTSEVTASLLLKDNSINPVQGFKGEAGGLHRPQRINGRGPWWWRGSSEVVMLVQAREGG